jgi:hypothetical protein
MQLILREPAPCGERPTAPAFGIEGQRLTLHYRVSAPNAATTCRSTVMVRFHGLPAGELEVVALSDAEGSRNLAFAD